MNTRMPIALRRTPLAAALALATQDGALVYFGYPLVFGNGNGLTQQPLTLADAQVVIWLDFPRWLCLWRIVRRVLEGDTEAFGVLVQRHPDRCRVWLGFDNALAHLMYGGCDLLLMPSIYEPCGLNQIYSLRATNGETIWSAAASLAPSPACPISAPTRPCAASTA